jgi:hypothetical protein
MNGMRCRECSCRQPFDPLAPSASKGELAQDRARAFALLLARPFRFMLR